MTRWAVAVAAMLGCETVAFAEGESAIELTVRPEPFARFDHTRWRVDTQVGMPYPAVMYALFNDEVQFTALDVSMVVACDLDGEASSERQWVRCLVEDASIRLVPWLRNLPQGTDAVVRDTDDVLTGLEVVLEVGADGRVLDVGLLNEPQTNRRINLQYENVRQVVLRAMLGFHMRTPETYTVGEDWVERNSRLFTLPAFRYSAAATAAGSGTTSDERSSSVGGSIQSQIPDQQGTGSLRTAFRRASSGVEQFTGGFRASEVHPYERILAPAGFGRSTIVNRMDAWRGQYIVQSTGEGTVNMGSDVPVIFTGDLTSVAAYDPSRGYMTERRWTVELRPTASSPFANGIEGWPYWQVGSLYLLGQDEPSDVGESGVLAQLSSPRGQVAP